MTQCQNALGTSLQCSFPKISGFSSTSYILVARKICYTAIMAIRRFSELQNDRKMFDRLARRMKEPVTGNGEEGTGIPKRPVSSILLKHSFGGRENSPNKRKPKKNKLYFKSRLMRFKVAWNCNLGFMPVVWWRPCNTVKSN